MHIRYRSNFLCVYLMRCLKNWKMLKYTIYSGIAGYESLNPIKMKSKKIFRLSRVKDIRHNKVSEVKKFLNRSKKTIIMIKTKDITCMHRL